jgi:hypothetical protein
MQQINPRIRLRLYILAACRKEKSSCRLRACLPQVGRKGRKKSLGDLPSAGRLGAFARTKKEDLRGGRGRYQNKLACKRKSVKENTSSFLLKGTLLLIFELNPCNPIFHLLI